MILYLDTSNLVKLYVLEADSEIIKALVADASLIVTSRIACPEFYSALMRRRNRIEISEEDYDRLCTLFADDWERLSILDFNELEAGRLVRKHGLRGADAIHLASAVLLAQADESVEMVFSSADRKLNEAAVAEGLLLRPTASSKHVEVK